MPSHFTMATCVAFGFSLHATQRHQHNERQFGGNEGRQARVEHSALHRPSATCTPPLLAHGLQLSLMWKWLKPLT